MLSETIQTTGYNDSNYLERLERYMSDKKNTDNLPEWIDTRQASEIMGVEQDTVAEHCRNKTINCMKIGTSWAVSRVDAENFERSNRGRKPKTN